MSKSIGRNESRRMTSVHRGEYCHWQSGTNSEQTSWWVRCATRDCTQVKHVHDVVGRRCAARMCGRPDACRRLTSSLGARWRGLRTRTEENPRKHHTTTRPVPQSPLFRANEMAWMLISVAQCKHNVELFWLHCKGVCYLTNNSPTEIFADCYSRAVPTQIIITFNRSVLWTYQ